MSRMSRSTFCLISVLVASLAILPASLSAATLSVPTAKQVQKAMNLQSQNNLAEAAAILESLNSGSSYDRAFADRMLGAIYWQQGNTLKAINALMSAEKSGALNPEEMRSAQRMLADLLLIQTRYSEALTRYYPLVADTQTTDKEAGEIWFRIAQAQYQNKQAGKALDAVKRHLKLSPASVSALSLKLGAEVQLTQWKASTKTLERLIMLDPGNKTWWLQLVSSYQKLNDHAGMLNTLVLAERSGIALTTDEKMFLAQLYGKQGVPHKAARVLHAVNEQSPDAQRLAAEASYWQQAKEWDEAIDAWTSAAAFNPEYYWVAAQLALQHQQYQRALSLLEKVSDDTPADRLELARALAYDKLNQITKALQHAKRAHAAIPSKQTESWVQYLTEKQDAALRSPAK